MKIYKTSVPANAIIRTALERIDYQDAFAVRTHKPIQLEKLPPLFFYSFPKWFMMLMYIREAIAGWIGLKTAKDIDVRKQLRVMKLNFVSFLIIISLFACDTASNTSTPTAPNRSQQVYEVADNFFATYAERQDWEKLLSYYRPDMQFEDVLLQLKLDSLWQFERFYNWPDTNFQKLSPEKAALEVEHLVANDSVAIAYGHFTPFYWYGQLIDLDWGMNFTMIIEFDENLKIKKHIDWIEYDDTVLEAMIHRYRTEGVDKTPSWLNLER